MAFDVTIKTIHDDLLAGDIFYDKRKLFRVIKVSEKKNGIFRAKLKIMAEKVNLRREIEREHKIKAVEYKLDSAWR